MLPVFLAILFLGGSEQAIPAASHLSPGVHPRADQAKPASPRIVYANARTALCLLPTLLNQAYESGSPQAFGLAYPARRSGLAPLRSTSFTRESSDAMFSPTLGQASLWQRPPPAV
jgi:hypothetical protein